MTDELKAPVVYIDANPFIYFIDGREDVANRVRPFFVLFAERPGMAMTSELTLAEVLAKATPLARRSYLNFIVWSNLFRLQPVTRDILIDTANYRRVSRNPRPDGTKVTAKLPDAIHVVTATHFRCQIFLSADQGLKVPADMALLQPDDAGFAKLTQALA